MAGGGRLHDRAILDALESIDPEALKKTVWRVVRKGRYPLRGAVANGRWNAIGEFEVLYTSLAADGALAEVGHRLSLEPVWPSKIAHKLHRLKVKTERALRLDSLAQLERLGVDVKRYEGYEYTATQAIAAAANFLEFDAMLVPSASFNTTNLVVFLDRIQTPAGLLSSEEVDWAKWRARARR
jgi:RES domain-containing protein